MYLVADVGGTKTNIAIFSSLEAPQKWSLESKYSSQEYDSLEDLLKKFKQDHPVEIEAACICVAGPVLDGKATITNLPWIIEESSLQDVLQIKTVRLINDLVATALSVTHLAPEDLEKLNQGKANPNGTIAVLAPGTGLGQAYLTWDGARYRAYPSEGGHVDFAPTTHLEWGLLQSLQEKFGHVSVERVCSGLGITNVYRYLRQTGYAEEPKDLAEKIAQTQDPTPIIVERAMSEYPCELCRMTLNTFVEILGEQAGNLALTLLSTGGLYLGGGIPPRILSLLKGEKFYYAYRNKGRFEDILDQIPLHVILNSKAALIGASYEVLELVDV